MSWEEKFELDLWYVDNRSFLLDLRILFLTVKQVLLGSGVSAAGAATMPEFMGTPRPPGGAESRPGGPDGLS